MELKTPIRIYWDLPLESDAPCTTPAICQQILALRVLALDLRVTGETLPAELRGILTRVKGSGVAVSVSAAPSVLSPEVQEELSSLGVRGMLLEFSSLDALASLPREYWQRGAGASFAVSERTIGEVPEVVAYCLKSGVKRLVFPIQRALAGEAIFHLGAARGAQLAAELRRLKLPGNLQLTIHDPFLWKAFYPERAFPEGGCQAANSMVYIAPDAALYPCPVMPCKLGSLGEETLAQIIASPRKRQLRQRLLAPPAECLPCPEVKECLGGCRGKGYLLNESWDEADPSCR